MRASTLPLFTSKNDPADAQVASHRLLARAGYIRKQASGLYAYLPFGYIVHRKVEQIVREEMDRFGGVEVSLPVITPAALWQESGRWDIMGKEMMRMEDRHTVPYTLGPTHEEAMTDLARSFLQSYKQLPINLYQIGKKYRDEIRPRYGLIRCREFTMKDAYSYHATDASLDETYQKMRECYRSIFERCGLKTIPVEADSGNMGGSGSEEFMVASEIGEETLLLCSDNACGYRSNQEKTPYICRDALQGVSTDIMQEISTPNAKTIEDVAKLLGIDTYHFVKAVIFEDKENIYLCFIPGDRELSEVKMKNISGATEYWPANAETIETLTNAKAGFTGPVGLKYKDTDTVTLPAAFPSTAEKDQNTPTRKTLHVYFDTHLKGRKGLVVGANKTDCHLKDVNEGRDFTATNTHDLVVAHAGDLCPQCKKSALTETRGIEVGHIFKLGKKYSQKMNLTVLDPNGKPLVPTMGCYGIGVGRTVATTVEQNHDDRGIIWNTALSPFKTYLVSLAKGDTEITFVDKLYNTLKNAGESVYLDDRDERAGIKFNDAELVGFPFIVTVGKRTMETGKIELKLRRTGEKLELTENELLEFLRSN
ncbi:MAG: Proline--tRNA ligase [Turneriella sp.]|nr:Proline--tRNA ligase [Turneriella sp.]